MERNPARYTDRSHPLYELFQSSLCQSLFHRSDSTVSDEVIQYLSDLLIDFIHTDHIFFIRNRFGARLKSVSDMLQEADVLFGADSFAREREVHKHIGDYILFWSGVYPEFLLNTRFNKNEALNFQKQGKESYYVASTFDYEPYKKESKILKKLSCWFEDYTFALQEARKQFASTKLNQS